MAYSNWWPFDSSRYSNPWYSNDMRNGMPALGRVEDTSKIAFRCQLAHGSPTAIIEGVSTIQGLYQKISEAFELPLFSVNVFLIVISS